ncbi:MAG: hypothetical protein IKK37_06730 [Clostridia bacterium]|nr:hypothetical protein [Clostridia bacterium]
MRINLFVLQKQSERARLTQPSDTVRKSTEHTVSVTNPNNKIKRTARLTPSRIRKIINTASTDGILQKIKIRINDKNDEITPHITAFKTSRSVNPAIKSVTFI